jgi:hypothetical protein
LKNVGVDRERDVKRVSKRPSTKELPRWRISRLKKTPAIDLGTVAAPDA